MKNVIAYDMDGTLFSLKKAVQVFNRETNQNKKIKDIYDYSFATVFNIEKSVESLIWSSFSSEIIAESTVNQKLVDHLQIEAETNDILIVTARSKVYRKLNQIVLDKNHIPYTDIIDDVFDKYESLKNIKAKKFYDDRGELIESLVKTDLTNHCDLVLIDAPYNQSINYNNRFYLY